MKFSATVCITILTLSLASAGDKPEVQKDKQVNPEEKSISDRILGTWSVKKSIDKLPEGSEATYEFLKSGEFIRIVKSSGKVISKGKWVVKDDGKLEISIKKSAFKIEKLTDSDLVLIDQDGKKEILEMMVLAVTEENLFGKWRMTKSDCKFREKTHILLAFDMNGRMGCTIFCGKNCPFRFQTHWFAEEKCADLPSAVMDEELTGEKLVNQKDSDVRTFSFARFTRTKLVFVAEDGKTFEFERDK